MSQPVTRSEDSESLESERLKARLGEMLERELLEASEIASELREVAALEAGRPSMRRRSRR